MTGRLISAEPHASRAPGALGRQATGAFQLVQPFATIFLQATPATLFMWTAQPVTDVPRLLQLFSAVVALYGSIGALNDYYDLPLDRLSKPRKPLVRGLVTPRFALWQAAVLAIAGLSLSVALNWLTTAFSVLILALGIWYDVHAKRSLWSWVPYAVGIPTLPLWGFAAAGRFDPILLLAYPLGALLSVGLNISNTLPDHDVDAAFGLRALTHRLHLWQAILLAWGLFAATMLGFAAAAPIVGNNWKILGPGLAAGALLLLVMMGDYAICRSQRSLKRGWGLSGLFGIVVGLSWVASLPPK